MKERSTPSKGIVAVTAGLLLIGGCSQDSAGRGSEPTTPAPPISTTCAENNQPLTPEQYLCGPRRSGKLDIVLIPGLPRQSQFINTDVPSATAVGEYAAHTLSELSDGAVTLTPEVLEAPPTVAEEIMRRNKGFQRGENCVDTDDLANTMGQSVRDLMPQTHDATQVVALGGSGCRKPKGDIGGVAAYEPEKKYADVYDSNDVGGSFFEGRTEITALGGVIGHEEGHNYGFGHAGIIDSSDPKEVSLRFQNPTEPIDITALLRDPATTLSEYGELGNFMSNEPIPLTSGWSPDDLTNEPQIENFEEYKGTPPRRKADFVFTSSERVEITNDPADPVKSVELSMGEDIPLGNYNFSHMNLSPVFDNGHPRGIVATATTGWGEELATAQLDILAISQQPRTFTIGSRLVTAQVNAQNNGVDFMVASR